MSETLKVTITVDTDELRRWADKHADAGDHGVAHVLYKAASDGESLSEQAIQEAKAAGIDAVEVALRRYGSRGGNSPQWPYAAIDAARDAIEVTP